MRKQVRDNGLVVHGIAGTHVVLLGWDVLEDGAKEGLLGFAIQRTDHVEGDVRWLRGMKTFPDASPSLPAGGTASSHDQPIQSFQWADYAAKPGRRYTYLIVPMYGEPGALTDGGSVSIDLTTEIEWNGTHSVFFNRGAVASQEYARQFQNKPPSEVGAPAYSWLSRGLVEAIVAFIGRATDARHALRIAIYEFQWGDVLEAVRAAKQRGVDVKVLFDAIDNAKGNPLHPNEEQIAAYDIADICSGITHGKIMHNKFIVLSKDGTPTDVLTGSTNYTENGLFGHLNCAHVVHDGTVARRYLDYWTELSSDPALDDLRAWDGENGPAPPMPPTAGIQAVFSPQSGSGTLTRFGEIAAEAQRGLFMTFAFGMNKTFLPTYSKADGVLRFALMDTVGVGKDIAAARQRIDGIRQLPNTVVAIGQNVTLNSFDRWLKERSGITEHEHVRWVHTKFMLVDPLSDDPVVITGSANFSDASITTNHENMLVIRGNTRVADIYLGEFMRQFTSYAFRDAAASHASTGAATSFRPQDLVPNPSWIERYTRPGSGGALRRLYFSGQ